MKFLNRKSWIVAAVAALTTFAGCKKELVQTPRASLDPAYFATANGVKQGIIGVYSDLRNFFSNEGQVQYYAGTDEMIAGGSATSWTIAASAYNGINSSTLPLYRY
jgi:ABC-type taurine transport system substrate-binding protein